MIANPLPRPGPPIRDDTRQVHFGAADIPEDLTIEWVEATGLPEHWAALNPGEQLFPSIGISDGLRLPSKCLSNSM